jgi:hypothetical protein
MELAFRNVRTTCVRLPKCTLMAFNREIRATAMMATSLITTRGIAFADSSDEAEKAVLI